MNPLIKSFAAITLMLLSAITCAQSEVGESFIDTELQILEIEVVARQAEAWATCAALYRIYAALFEEDAPATAMTFSNQANGADVAIMMTYIGASIDEGDSADAFVATAKFAATAMESLPETQSAWILAMAETQDPEKWFLDAQATMDYCVSNQEAQQFHVDMWRELAQSGLL